MKWFRKTASYDTIDAPKTREPLREPSQCDDMRTHLADLWNNAYTEVDRQVDFTEPEKFKIPPTITVVTTCHKCSARVEVQRTWNGVDGWSPTVRTHQWIPAASVTC